MKRGITYHAVFQYTETIRQAIMALKFGHELHHTRLLGHLLSQCLKQHYSKLPELIIPVPLHKNRLRERGFNQVLEIAKEVKKELNIPIDKYSVSRHKATTPQAQCTQSQRRENVRAAFTNSKPIMATHIILLDDVITSGYTLHNCRRCIKLASSQQIDYWCLAKAA